MMAMEKKGAESFFIIEPCTSANGFEIKFKDKEKRIDLKKAEAALSKIGTTISGPSVLAAKLKDADGGLTLSVYGSGRIMIKAPEGAKKMMKEEAERVAKKILALFEKNGAMV